MLPSSLDVAVGGAAVLEDMPPLDLFEDGLLEVGGRVLGGACEPEPLVCAMYDRCREEEDPRDAVRNHNSLTLLPLRRRCVPLSVVTDLVAQKRVKH